MTPRLGPSLLGSLPPAVSRPGYDRAGIATGIVHLGVGAFHRSHQAEYTDDLLALAPGPWGITGVNLRPPELAGMLGAQDGLFTRVTLDHDRQEARVIGSILRVVDSQDDPEPALKALADPSVRVVTMTVTEKGYCHRPSSGTLDWDNAAVLADLAEPRRPTTLPGLLVRALEVRRATGAPPLTIMSCDNIPSNGSVLRGVVTDFASCRDEALAKWIETGAAFPQTMVDRIAPAVSEDDRARAEAVLGYRDAAAVVCEPFRQWVIEDSFAGEMPAWDRVGAQIVKDVAPFEIIKMRILNGAQTALSSLGALCGLVHTSDDMADPVLATFVKRMLVEETVPTLRPVPGIDAHAYVAQSLDRLSNTAIRHRNHQIATDASQKIVQRILNPVAERLHQGRSVNLLSVAVAAFMAYLVRGARRFGAPWVPSDPIAAEVAAIAEAIGNDPPALVAGIVGIRTIFAPDLGQNEQFRAAVASALAGLLSPDPRSFVADRCRSEAALP